MKKKRVLAWLLCLAVALTSFGVPEQVAATGQHTTGTITLNVKSSHTM